jgi:hypothetical protein
MGPNTYTKFLLLRRFEEIDKLSEKDKGTIKEILDTFILKKNFKAWLRLSSCKGGRTKMNKAAITKHDIYNNLIGFTEQDLSAIANFIDFMRHKNQLEEKKVLKLQGILKGYDFDFSDLKKFKKQSWEHVEQEFSDG